MIHKWLGRVRLMPGADRLFRRIASASDRNQLEDYLAEVMYSLVFAGLGFQVEIEPFGGKGPDLRVSRNGHSAIVEVMRFRKMYPGPTVIDPTAIDPTDDYQELPAYGDPGRDIRKTFGKIRWKFRQTENAEAIIAIWNDDEDLEDTAVLMAVHDIRRDTARSLLLPPIDLLFVLYGSKWVRAGDRKQLYCFPLRDSEQPHQVTWQQELASSSVSQLIQRALVS